MSLHINKKKKTNAIFSLNTRFYINPQSKMYIFL